ncbi:uncharacterized protein YecE (DUF72 family) [Pseudomonas duriflava]|uniref:Uncharacterized protein YecE (DUF72 family) n=1 Tax=Pseudomonas duriflava TaxID=459528 RepID=A0A562QCG7_9PSED|nr:DUF72 domain-containing protein [Pseudomonas duriflava]TWI53716.1 uncharacterized protein YecE (DUF72 family) [Pseudomonas duriflava]
MADTTAISLGCAGWSLPRTVWALFPSEGTHLERYSAGLPAVEINSSFYRPHRPATYAKWASSVPSEFRFSVKMPRQITHEQRLKYSREQLATFLAECSHLSNTLGCPLIQLPPSLVFEAETARAFYEDVRDLYSGGVVLEPRHSTWLSDTAQMLLHDYQIGQVAADPSPLPGGDQPSGWPGIVYYRLHGSPDLYHSTYSLDQLKPVAHALRACRERSIPAWCIFDNTASGAAVPNALDMLRLLAL